jgi:outer membrane receptor for ferrienterochelin and colicin
MWENHAYFTRESFLNSNKSQEILDRGKYSEFTWRSDLSVQAGRRHRLESGTLIRFIRGSMVNRRYNFTLGQFLDYDSIDSRYGHQSFYAQDRCTMAEGRLTAIAGIRIENTGLNNQAIVSPRAQLEWRLKEKSRIDIGWGVYSQFPELLPVRGHNGDPKLRAEISQHYVLGFEQLLNERMRLRLEFYDKRESDLLRSRDSLFRLEKGKVAAPDPNYHFDNALRGETRGFEIFLQRRSANRLAGWISYAFSNSRREDLATGEKYSNEFEQEHTANIYASYRFSEKWNFSVKARFGSGFPFPGYFEERGADLYLSTERNHVRLPYYGRIDLRLNRAFYYAWGKLSLYLELLNLTNRDNKRFEQVSSVNSTTRKVNYRTDSLLPILPTAGFTLEF